MAALMTSGAPLGEDPPSMLTTAFSRLPVWSPSKANGEATSELANHARWRRRSSTGKRTVEAAHGWEPHQAFRTDWNVELGHRRLR